MPAMYVNVPKLEQSVKDALVSKLYEAALPVLKAPHIFTFVNEYATLYENGKPTPEQKMIVCNIEAGPSKPEKIETLAQNLLAAAKDVLGDDRALTLVYHANATDHIASNGKLISSTIKPK